MGSLPESAVALVSSVGEGLGSSGFLAVLWSTGGLEEVEAACLTAAGASLSWVSIGSSSASAPLPPPTVDAGATDPEDFSARSRRS